jgi:PKD repeat protein
VISQPQSICSGATPATITGSAPTQGNGIFSYLWQQSTDSPLFSTWNPAPGTNDLIDYTPGALTQTTRYRRIVYSGVCDLPSNVIEKTVNPIPSINSLPTSTICSGVALNYAITSSAPGTTYTWNVTDLSGGSITGANPYSGSMLSTIPDVLTNNSSVPKTIQYTITPKGPAPTFCPGADFPVIVTVRPKFNSTYNDQSINSGTSTTLTGLITGGTPGTGYSYSWTPSNKIASGQSTWPNPLTTILTAPQSYTLNVTDAALCQFTQVITISTSGIPLNAVITSSDFDNTLCEGSSITLTATATGGGGNGIPANYTYIWNGLPGGVSYIHPWEVQFIPSNIGSNIYTVDVGDGFTTTTASKTLTVSKIPSVTSVLEKQICSGGDVAYTPLSDVPGTTFNWVRGFNTYITSLPPDNNGSGTINNILSNSYNTVETVKYTITPTGPAPTYCVGSSAELIVSVKPVASITNPGNSQIVVSGYPSSSVTFTSNVAAAGIHWKYSATSSSCPGLISFAQYQGYTPTLPVQTITLLPGAPATCILSYLVRPYLIITVGDTCWGNQFTYNFIINSEPAKYNMICPLPICAGQTATVSLSNSDIGIEYRLYRGVTWIPPMIAGQNAQLDWTGINVSGNYTVKATNTTNGQTTLMNGMCQVIINPNPIPNYVIGSTGHCSGDIITLNGSETGIDYELYILGSPIEMHTGTGGILNFTNTSMAGTYTIKATNNTTGCWNWIDGSVVIYENPAPFLFSPGGILCVGDELWLENSETGAAYQLWCIPFAGGPDVLVSTAPGTSFPLSFGLQSIAGTYYVHAINLLTNCDLYFADRKTFRLNPQLFNITPQAAAIPNCGLTLIGLDDSEIGIAYDVYQLDASGIPLGFPFPGLSSVTGTGSSIVFGSTNVVGEYVVIGRYSDGVCSSRMNGSVVISSKPTQYQMDPTGPRCIDQTTGIEVKLLNSDNGVNYTLSNGSNSWTVAGGANPLSFGNITLAGTYSITANNPLTDCSETMPGSLTLTLNPNRYTLYPVSPDNNFCPGQYDIWIGGSQAGVSYTLHTPNTPLVVKVGTGGPLNWGKFYYPGDYTVTAQFASGQACPVNLGTVHIYSKPGMYTITVPSGSCENALIGLSGSDANTTYELLNYPALTATGATHTGGTGSFNFSTLQPAGSYVVRAVNSNSCDTIMTGIAVVDPLPTVDAGPAVIFSCITPDFVVLNGTATHFSSVQWNSTTDPTGLNFSPNNNLSTTYTFTASDKTNHVASISLKAFGTAGCISSQVSDNIIVNILVPEVNAGPDQVVCANQEVQLAAIVSGGASTGIWVGGSGTFDPDRAAPNAKYTPSLVEAGTTVVLTFMTTNASPCDEISDQMQITVFPELVPGMAGPNQTICAGESLLLTGTVPTGGSGTANFTYQWQYFDGTTWSAATAGSGGTTLAYTTGVLSATTRFRLRQTDTYCAPGQVRYTNEVTITVNNLNAGTISADLTICENQATALSGTVPTIADGTISYQWQSSPDGIVFTDISLATAQNYTTGLLISDTWFRRVATSTLNSVPCSSTSNTVKVTVNNLKAGTISANSTICESQSAALTGTVPTIADGIVSYQWQSSSDGITFADITLATLQNYSTIPLVADSWFRRIATSSLNAVLCSSISNSVKVTVNNLNAGMISSDITICENQTAALTGTVPGLSDGTISYQWQSGPDGITFTDISLATTQNYTTTPLASDNWFRRIATSTLNSVLCSSISNNVKVTVNNLTAGTISADVTICENQSASLTCTVPTLADGTIGYQWQSSPDGITFTDIPLATTQNYTTVALTADRWFRRIVTSTLNSVPCTSASAAVKVTVNNLNAGTIGSDITICENQTSTLTGSVPTLFDGTISYQWQSSPDGIIFTDILLATSQNYTTAALAADTWYRRFAISNLNLVACSSTSNTVKVTVNNMAAGSISADVTICENQSVVLSGTVPSITDGTISYQWQSSSDGIVFANISLATLQNYNTSALIADTWYRRIATSTLNLVICSNTSNTVKVTVNNLTAGTIGADITICENQTTALSGSAPSVIDGSISYQWQSSTDGILFTDISLATSQNYTTIPLSFDIWFRRIATSSLNTVLCSSTSNIVKVTVNNLNAGTISSDITICENQAAVLTGTVPTLSDGTVSYQWQLSPDGIAFTNIALATLQNYTSMALTADTWFRRIATSTLNFIPCSGISNTVKVTVNNINAGTISTDITICENQTASLTCTIPSISDGSVSYQWQSSSDGIIFSDISLATFQNYTTTDLTADRWFRRISASTLNYIVCTSISTAVKVTVNNLTAGTISSDITLCENQIAALTGTVPGIVDGTISYQWQSSADGILFTNISLANLQNYTSAPLTADIWYRRIATSSLNALLCTSTSNTVKVTVNNLTAGTISPDMTICENQAATLTGSLPAIFDGTISYQWQSSPDGIAFTDIYLATSQNYTSTPLSVNTWFRRIAISTLNSVFCSSISTITKVTVNPLPVPTILSGQTPACINTPFIYTTQAGMNNYDWEISPPGTYAFNYPNPADKSVIQITWTATGLKTVAVNYKNQFGCFAAAPSPAYSVDVVPAPVYQINGPALVCENATVTYQTAASMTNYQWEVTGGTIISGGTTADYEVTVHWTTFGAKTIRVNYIGLAGCFALEPAILNVVVVPAPTPTIINNAPSSVCIGDAGVVYTTQSGMTAYAWTVTGGTITGGQGTNSVLITWNTAGPGSVTVSYSYSNTFGCTAVTPTVYPVTVNPLPVPSLTGNAVVCSGSEYLYTSDLAMNNYLWTVSSGGTITAGGTPTSNTATVLWSSPGVRSVTVTYTNSNGCIAAIPAALAVNVKALPIPHIYGNLTPCPTVEYGYSTEQGMTQYTWSISAGGTIQYGTDPFAVTANWSTPGANSISVVVKDNDGCVSAAPPPETLVVDVLPLPAEPVISGSNTACENSSGNVYTTETGKSNYVWSIPAGGTITGGAGTSSISVSWGSPGIRTITVQYINSNSCSSIPMTVPFTVTVAPRPVPTFPVAAGTNNPSPCLNQTALVYSTQTGMSNYIWTVTSGGIITAGGNTGDPSVTVTWNSVGPQNVTVSYTDPATGCSAAGSTVFPVDVKPLPVPTITSTASIVCVNSSGNIYTTQTGKTDYNWTIPDGSGTIIAGQGTYLVTVSWTLPGIHSICVTYKDNNLCEAVAPGGCYTVTVNALPVPTISGAGTSCRGESKIYTTEGGMAGYQWVAAPNGEIISGNGTNSIFVKWKIAGINAVTVNYSNSYGCTAVTATAYNVTVNEQPVSRFMANSVCFGNLTNFTDQSVPNSGTINLWNWDFGDPTSAGNNTSTNQNPSHLFTSWGSYNVKLVVTNSNGCVHDSTISVTVNPNPLANFATIAANNCLNTPTKFNDLSALPQGQINKWKWDFGVATLLNDTSVSQNPSYQYNLPGIYHVKLKVTSVFGCSDSIVLPVQIFKPPTANFRFTSIPCENGKVSFQDSSFAFQTSVVAWNWEFEPYQNSIAQNPVHVFYDMDSCYNVSLIAKDFRGCFDTIIKQVCVPSALKIGFTSSETCLGDSTRFIPHLVAPLNDSLVSFNWNFNDQGSGTNNTSTRKFPSHYFSLPGTYQVSLSATDKYNCTVPNPIYINVVVKPLPTATFTYHEGVCDSLVTFKKPEPGVGSAIVSWLWEFGDGDSIHFQNTHPATLLHKYPGAGFYTVKLTVKNSDSCSNIITTPNVWVKPCLVASVSLSDTLTCQNQTFAFADNSVSGIPVSSWKWNFGDGDSLLYTTYRDTVYHTFQLPGNYTVKIRISGSVSGNSVADTSQVIVKVRQTPLADFVIPDNKFCVGGKASFTNTSNGNGSEINSWKWDFGDSASSSDVSTLRDPVDYQYSHYGSFSVRLIAKNTFGCADTNFKPVTVFQLPESAFKSMNACVSQLTVFNDQTIGYDTTIATWNWSISDSVNGFVNYQTTQNATYTFDKLGIYLVSLKTIDANGCRDSLQQRVTIYNKPFSAFTFTENIDNIQGQVQFTNGSSGATAYLWDFGNGQKNTHETPPVITYSQNGVYQIKLIASENSTTCADTANFTYNFVLKGLYIPNAFSPNNPKEGVRLLKPVGMGISEYLFEVFDRWGNPVYRSDSLDAEGRPVGGWDGKLNGVEMPIGAYVWKASAVFLDGTIWNADDVGVQEDRFKFKFGTATLIR